MRIRWWSEDITHEGSRENVSLSWRRYALFALASIGERERELGYNKILCEFTVSIKSINSNE